MLALLPIDVADGLRKEQLKKSGLGRVVMFLYKLPDETQDNRRIAKVGFQQDSSLKTTPVLAQRLHACGATLNSTPSPCAWQCVSVLWLLL